MKTWEEQIPEEMEKATQGNWPGGILSLLLFSLPVILFALPGWLLWSRVVDLLPQADPYFFWGLWLGIVQVCYIVAAGGYGALGIPATLLLFWIMTR